MVSKKMVSTAFESLIIEMESSISDLNRLGGEKFTTGDYEGVDEIKGKAEKAASLIDQVRGVQDVWNKLFLYDGSISHQKGQNQISVILTQGAINHSYINIVPFVDFFPDDTVGASNKSEGEGRYIRLHVSGFTEIIETDIAERMFIRKRGWVSDLIEKYGLKSGDQVVFERLSAYEYRVHPKKEG